MRRPQNTTQPSRVKSTGARPKKKTGVTGNGQGSGLRSVKRKRLASIFATRFEPHVSCDDIEHYLKSRLAGNVQVKFAEEAGPAKAVAAVHVLDPDQWPEREHVLNFGTEEVAFLIEWFAVPLTRQCCAVGEVLSQWRALKFEVVSNANLKNRSFFSLWEMMLTKDTYREQYKDIVHLALIYMAIPMSAAGHERIMSTMKRIKSDQRSSLHVSTTNDLIRISNDTMTMASYQPDTDIKSWMTSSVRQRRPQYKGWPSLVAQADSGSDTD